MMNNKSDLLICPYNHSHRVSRKRYAVHLQKCAPQHPDIELKKCLFNSTHLISEANLKDHMTNCPDRKIITQYKYESQEQSDDDVVNMKPIECDENWDDANFKDYNPKNALKDVKIIRRPRKRQVSVNKTEIGENVIKQENCETEKNKYENKSQYPTCPKTENKSMRKIDLQFNNNNDNIATLISMPRDTNEQVARVRTPPPPDISVEWNAIRRKLKKCA